MLRGARRGYDPTTQRNAMHNVMSDALPLEYIPSLKTVAMSTGRAPDTLSCDIIHQRTLYISTLTEPVGTFDVGYTEQPGEHRRICLEAHLGDSYAVYNLKYSPR